MELSSTRIIAAPPQTVWKALNDPAILKDCLPGCESLERVGDNAYEVVLAARVGPVSARFTGRMTMSDVTPSTGYTLAFDGQGGAAGFARGEARVTLAAAPNDATALTYAAKAQVGGRLAQVGSRLVDGVAAKMADDFFARFAERVRVPGAAVADSAPTRLAPPGGSPWIRYAAIAIIIVVLVVLYMRGFR
jgi:carbon monoxide dehydrogenase subunit G